MRVSKTHFEQIPVETVKKIASEIPETRVQTLDERPPAQENWRELAKQIQEEQDSKKITQLVTQLLAEFDKRDLGNGSGSVGTKRP